MEKVAAATGALQRYESLRLRDFLSLPCCYTMACTELQLIIRLGYSTLPTPIQSLLFDHAIAAFHLLPQVQTGSAVGSAVLLMLSAEAVFPQHKRELLDCVFKQAIIAHIIFGKTQHKDVQVVQLPQDVLVNRFSFLDIQSLLSAAMVCRSWNLASKDKYLWRSLYITYFGDPCDSSQKVEGLLEGAWVEDRKHTPSSSVPADVNVTNLDWKCIFKGACTGLPYPRFKFNRGYCAHCNSVFLLDSLKCPNECFGNEHNNQRLIPVSPNQIVKYLVNNDLRLNFYYPT